MCVCVFACVYLYVRLLCLCKCVSVCGRRIVCQGSIIKIFPSPFKIGRTRAGMDEYAEQWGRARKYY